MVYRDSPDGSDVELASSRFSGLRQKEAVTEKPESGVLSSQEHKEMQKGFGE